MCVSVLGQYPLGGRTLVPDVRLGSEAETTAAIELVRFVPNGDNWSLPHFPAIPLKQGGRPSPRGATRPLADFSANTVSIL